MWWLQGFADRLVDGQFALTDAPVHMPPLARRLSLSVRSEHQARGRPYAHVLLARRQHFRVLEWHEGTGTMELQI